VQASIAYYADPLTVVGSDPPAAWAGEPDPGDDLFASPTGRDERAGRRGGRAGRAESADAAEAAPVTRLTIPQPPGWKRLLDVAIVTTKTITLACAVDAMVNAESPRLRGKAIRTRAVGYTLGLALVPAVWRLLPDRGRYPRGLDLAVTTPLLLDAVGNALGLYERAHIDDVVHFLNAGIVSGVAGALFAGQVEKPWHAALAGTGASIAGETTWEIAEYVAMKAGADNMDLGYEDTMGDLIASTLGAIAGGVVTWLRMPRSKEERRRGWRHAVSGWREAGEPIPVVGGPDTVADTTSGAAAT
jgi:hypothetical protein